MIKTNKTIPVEPVICKPTAYEHETYVAAHLT
jgi:hypothetical protein